MNNIDKQYQALLQDILDNGVKKGDRTGTGTISVFGRQIRHKMSEGFPLLTTKKMPLKSIITELLWFLKGDTNIKYLVNNNCHIWNGDCYQAYLKWANEHSKTHLYEPYSQEEFINKIKTDDEFAETWGNLGPIYGKQWRQWSTMGRGQEMNGMFTIEENMKMNSIDQIQNLINDLKTNPDSRRLMVNAWNVSHVKNGSMVLPPCHYGFQVYTRELSPKERIELAGGKIQEKYPALIEQSLKVCDEREIPTRAISLMFNMRSNDVPLGLPFNIASYALLLEIIGKMVNMVPDELIANLGDAHIYKNQLDGIKEQLTREPYKLPTLNISNDIDFTGTIDAFLNTCDNNSFKVDEYESHPSIKIPLSN